jgi:beta-galactosidase GanA
MDDDIALMRDMGVNLVRFGEFAWSRMETKDGEFNFARVIRLVVGP